MQITNTYYKDKANFDLENSYTVKDYLNLQEGIPYQLIEGELIMTPSPITRHQVIARNIFRKVDNFVHQNKLGYTYFAPIDIYLNDVNVYQPDIVFVAEKNKDIIKEKGIFGSPDMIIEILSPATAYYDLKTKKNVYEKGNVLEYIIIDPIDKTIESFINENFKFKSFKNQSEVGTICIKTIDLNIDLKEVFTER